VRYAWFLAEGKKCFCAMHGLVHKAKTFLCDMHGFGRKEKEVFVTIQNLE
jgi:hypothetical protein